MKLLLPIAIALSMVFAPLANATSQEQNYVNDMKKIGISSTSDDNIAQAGEEVCVAIKQGMTQQQVAQVLYQGSQQGNGNNGVTQDQATQAVALAVQDLCTPTVVA
jgi:hypothetical protein